MDLQRYAELKEKGLATLAKVGNAFVLSQDKYDQYSREALDPEVQAVSKQQIVDAKEQLTKTIKSLDTLLADMDALTVV